MRTLPLLALVTLLPACRSTTMTTMPPSFHGITPLLTPVPSHYREFRGLVVDEISTEMRSPLLPFVFFDSASAAIPRRYRLFTDPDQTGMFDESRLTGDHGALSHQVLNLIGSRMRNHPRTTIAIVGCNADRPREGERLHISERRARVIHDYLVGIWRIESSRITLLPPRALPEHPSTGDDRTAAEENRRAEIISGDYELLRPVVVRDLRRYPAPASVRFYIRNPLPDSLVDTRLIEIRRRDMPWHVMDNIGRCDTLSPEFNWGRNGKGDDLPTDETPYTARLVVVDRQGEEHRSDTVTIPVEIVDAEKKMRYGRVRSTIEVFTLLLPDTMDIGGINERFLREQVVPLIDSTSTVEIIGSGDFPGAFPTGDDQEIERRVDRARRNAEVVLTTLRRLMKREGAVMNSGSPIVDPLLRGRVPEDRFYLRRVTIRIVTPIGT